MRALLLFAAPLVAGLAFVACSSSSDPEPPTTFKNDTGTSSETAVDSGTSETAPEDGAVDSFVPTDTAGCVGDGGCFACKPTSSEQFLNHCSGSSCSPFDNAVRIPAATWDGGKLPPVP
jgi:hypothetical protein